MSLHSKKLHRSLLSLVTAGSLALASPSVFSAAPNQIELPWFASLDCAGNLIDLEGTVNIMVKNDYDGGRLNWMTKIRVNAHGYSQTSGDEYRGTINGSESLHDDGFTPPLPTNYSYREVGVLIGKGPAPDYRYRVGIKFTLANGEIIVDEESVVGGGCEYL